MLFLVRLAQGMVHMGKGLLTVNPYTADRQLITGEARGWVAWVPRQLSAVLASCLLCGGQ